MCIRRYHPTIRKIVKYCSKYLYGDENELKALVAKGPVVVGVTLTINMLYYKSGIFYDPSCSKFIDHAIVRIFALYFFSYIFLIFFRPWLVMILMKVV